MIYRVVQKYFRTNLFTVHHNISDAAPSQSSDTTSSGGGAGGGGVMKESNSSNTEVKPGDEA
jgi:hypothetical protein